MKRMTALQSVKPKAPKPKKVKLPKEKTTAKLVEEFATVLQRLVRVEAADENGMTYCITCNKPAHWSDLQGGHFISRTHLATKVVIQNINPQCYYCNHIKAKDGLMIMRYQDWMVAKHGQAYVDYLKREATKPIKFERSEILLLLTIYKKRLADLEALKPAKPRRAEVYYEEATSNTDDDCCNPSYC